MKRQRAKQRPLYRYDVYRGRRRGQARLIGAAGCAVFGLLLVLIRSLGIRFSGFLLLGLAALLVLSWLLDRLAAGNHRWRLIHRGFYGCLTVGLAALLGLEVFIINRGRSDMTPLPADAVIVLGAGVNGTEPSLSLRTRLDKAVDYLERWPDIPAVLTGGTGYGEEISEAACMYDYLTAHGVEPGRLILEDQATNTAENFALSKPLLYEAGGGPSGGTGGCCHQRLSHRPGGADRCPGGLRRRGRDPSAAALGSFGDQLHPAGGLCHGKDLSV